MKYVHGKPSYTKKEKEFLKSIYSLFVRYNISITASKCLDSNPSSINISDDDIFLPFENIFYALQILKDGKEL